MPGFLDRVAVAVSSFVDSGICAFASACGDSFEDLGDGVRLCPVQGFGGKIPPGW
jgi:hypothetical protein